MSLEKLGWNSFFAEAVASANRKGRPARVASVSRGAYLVWDAEGEWPAVLRGKMLHIAKGSHDLPVTGDWVLVSDLPNEEKLVIEYILPRKTALCRTAAGNTTERQYLATNIDTIFVTVSLSAELKLRRIERYLTAVWDSGAEPVLILTKADLCKSVDEAIAKVQVIARNAAIVALSGVTGQGIKQLKPWLKAASTSAIVGPSGVGKSTLINALYGEEILDVIPVRETDQKGRHTTTRRELVYLPNKALIIDTPGIRELQLWDGHAGLLESFNDIEELAVRCRFTNCEHKSEPGCLILPALASGELDKTRYASYLKLRQEVEEFDEKKLARAQLVEKRSSKLRTKQFHDRLKDKGRR